MSIEEQVKQVNGWEDYHWPEMAVRRQAKIEELVSLLREALKCVDNDELVQKLVRRDEVRNGLLVLDLGDRVREALEEFEEEVGG